MKYFDYDNLFTYSEALVYFITGARGTGKTFNAKIKAVERFDKAAEKHGGGGRFVAITRYAKNKEKIERAYFEKIQAEGYLTGFDFFWKNDFCYRKIKGTDIVDHIGYCVALTEQGLMKEETYAELAHGTIIFDEVTIDRRDVHHRYLKDEYDFYFLSVLSSLLRENPDKVGTTKVLMIGNAVDMICPYYDAFGVTYPMLAEYGRYWCNDKTVLFVNSADKPEPEEASKTIVGRLSAGTKAHKMIFENRYEDATGEFIEKKPSRAKFLFSLYFGGDYFGVWYDAVSYGMGGTYYVSPKVPRGQGVTYTLTLPDNRIDYQAVRKADNVISSIVKLHYAGRLRYHNELLKAKFLNFLKFVGVV